MNRPTASTKKHDALVIVIGGGPAGSTAARLLATHGLDVVLVEKNLSFKKPCGGGVVMSAFEEFDIPKGVIKREVRAIEIVSPGGTVLEIPLNGGGLAMVDRREFDAALRREAEAKGAQILEGECLRVEQGRTVSVFVKSGETVRELTAECAIAADGVNSRMRAAVGVKPNKSFFTMSAFVPDHHTERCEFWFGAAHAPRSYSWVFPAQGGSVIGTATTERGDILSLFERFRERRGIRKESAKELYRIPLWSGDLYRRGNILFAGDAAGHVMPLTHEGIYYAMRAGVLAAEAVISGDLGTYEKRWKSAFEKRFILMAHLERYFLKDDASADRLVELHRKPDIQAASLRLWLRKERGAKPLRDYMRLFKEFIR